MVHFNGLRRLNRNYLFLLIASLAISCQSSIVGWRTNKTPEVKHFVKGSKTVVYIPMSHLGKKSFFEGTKKIIDSLRKDGFTIYREGLTFEERTDSLSKVVLRKKLRSLLGETLTASYDDPNNKSTPKWYRSGKFEAQGLENIGLSASDPIVDVTYQELIAAHEKENQTIILTACDSATDLMDKYDCKKNKNTGSFFYAVYEFREKNLFDEVTNAKDDKIAIVYGRAHFKFFYPLMRDDGWTYLNDKLRF